jgi:hypothetical protein
MSRFEKGTKVIVTGVHGHESLATVWGRIEDDLFRIIWDDDNTPAYAYVENMRVLTKLDTLLLGLDK